MTTSIQESLPDIDGRFGPYGGKFVPETLMQALAELEQAYEAAKQDSSFQEELQRLSQLYAGRPTPLYHARNLSQELGGAQIYFKREDLAHTGAHKINNALGQGLLTARMGKVSEAPPIIAQTLARPRVISTASRRRPYAPCSTRSASSTWARRTSDASRPTSSA